MDIDKRTPVKSFWTVIKKETVIITILTKLFAICLIIDKSFSGPPRKNTDSLKPKVHVRAESKKGYQLP